MAPRRVLRLYESCGQVVEAELCGLPAGARAWDLTVAEDKLSEHPVLNGRLRLNFRPWQVRTLLVED